MDAYTPFRPVGTGRSFSGINRTEREPGRSSVVPSPYIKNIFNYAWSLPHAVVAWF